jgi:hypothetical protein
MVLDIVWPVSYGSAEPYERRADTTMTPGAECRHLESQAVCRLALSEKLFGAEPMDCVAAVIGLHVSSLPPSQ